jgi:hypothetical protein
VGLVLYIWNWVTIGDGSSVEGSIVTAMPSAAVLLGHEVESGRSWALGTSGCIVL